MLLAALGLNEGVNLVRDGLIGTLGLVLAATTCGHPAARLKLPRREVTMPQRRSEHQGLGLNERCQVVMKRPE